MTVVSVYIIDENDEPAGLRRQGSGRYKAVWWVNSVDPDHEVANRYLSVDRPTTGISIESSSLECENVHEESLCSLHIFVYSQRDDRLGLLAKNA